MGHEVKCAQNGSEALEILLEQTANNNQFDLVLCDLQMPILTGEELISKMKQRKIKTPVLVITGVGDKESIIRLMRLGCRDFISKPFTPDEIETRIIALLKDFSAEITENTRKEYMACIGEKAKASIHDINNFVGVAMGYADMVLEDIGENELLRNRLNKILRSTQRTADICHELLSFNPNTSVCSKNMTDLNVIVERVAALLQDISAENISIITGDHKFPVWIIADAWQLQHSLLNLGFNAADAMPNGGEIRFSIQNDKINASKDSFISIKVEDNGIGIHQDILPKIFESGFTTKYKGHGIGLANIKRIVEDHGGTITVDSNPEKGSCFTILLPKC
jgi:signal transduction histidine kinase